MKARYVILLAALFCAYVSANPIEQPVTKIAGPITSPITEAPKKDLPVKPDNGTAVAPKPQPASTNGGVAPEDVNPQPHDDTTVAPETTSTITPPTAAPTNATTTTTTSTTTTLPPPTNATTTAKPAPTPEPTTPKPSPSTTDHTKTTVAPTTPAPHSNDRKFDGPSFIGGIILAVGLTGIAFVAFKFYKARTEHNYHTL